MVLEKVSEKKKTYIRTIYNNELYEQQPLSVIDRSADTLFSGGVCPDTCNTIKGTSCQIYNLSCVINYYYYVICHPGMFHMVFGPDLYFSFHQMNMDKVKKWRNFLIMLHKLSLIAYCDQYGWRYYQ